MIAKVLSVLTLAVCPMLHGGQIFSSGFVLPETISLAPASFGLPAGSLVVADAGNLALSNPQSAIYAIPGGGGTPVAIGGAFNSGGGTFGGMFAPSTFGSLSGDYLAFGYNGTGAGIYALDSATGTLTPIYTDPTVTYSLNTPVLAPSGFGAASGDILVPESFYTGTTGTIDALSSTGAVSTFASISNFAFNGTVGGFGTAFAPTGFILGSTGPVLLVSDTNSGLIDWIDSSGAVHVFADVPLMPGQTGLRQMAFAPSGFGAYGGDLFISVSGSAGGGGTFGSVDVLNSSGQLVGIINEGAIGAPFDPRGLYFVDNTQLLIADSDPSIYSVPPTDVSLVPEPAAFLLAACGILSMALVSKLRNKLGAILFVCCACLKAGTIYNNGAVNGQLNAEAINGGIATADSFSVSSAAIATGVTFATWRDVSSDVFTTIDWAITSTDFGGTTFASGSASVAETFLFNNSEGVAVFSDTFSLPSVTLAVGTYWLQLSNAVMENSVGAVVNAPLFWDENNGPSAAFQQIDGTVIESLANSDLPNTTGSETFSIAGTTQSSAVPEPATVWLTLSAFPAILLAIFFKEKLYAIFKA